MHCVSSYPLNDIDINFNKFKYLKRKFKKVGYSGHSSGIKDAIWAISNNALVVEKHFTINNNLKGRDNKFSITPKTLKQIVEFRNFHFLANYKKSIDLQKCEKDVFKNYRGRWKLND